MSGENLRTKREMVLAYLKENKPSHLKEIRTALGLDYLRSRDFYDGKVIGRIGHNHNTLFYYNAPENVGSAEVLCEQTKKEKVLEYLKKQPSNLAELKKVLGISSLKTRDFFDERLIGRYGENQSTYFFFKRPGEANIAKAHYVLAEGERLNKENARVVAGEIDSRGKKDLALLEMIKNSVDGPMPLQRLYETSGLKKSKFETLVNFLMEEGDLMVVPYLDSAGQKKIHRNKGGIKLSELMVYGKNSTRSAAIELTEKNNLRSIRKDTLSTLYRRFPGAPDDLIKSIYSYITSGFPGKR